MAKITYNDKVALITNPDIADENKVTDNDMNEIKQVVNENAINISNEVDEDYRVNFLKGKNLFNANNVLNGMGIASGGTITSATDNGLFYIPVIAEKTYVFSFTDNGVSGNIVWGYTSQAPANGVSCTYNVMTNANLNGATFTPTGTQKYLCIRLNTSANNQYKSMSNIQIEEGSTATSYEAFIPNQIVVDNEKYSDTLNVGSVVDSRSRVNVLYSKNLFDKNSEKKGYLINNNGEEIANAVWSASNFIQTNSNKEYTLSSSQISGTSEHQLIVAEFNSSKGFIQRNVLSSLATSFTASSTTAYVRVCYRNDLQTNIMLEKGSTALPYEPYITPSIYVDNEEIYSKPVLLWENGSPNSSFAAQAITLNDSLANYKYYEIMYRFSYTNDVWFNTGRIPSNKTTILTFPSNQFRRRQIYAITNTQITFESAFTFTSYGQSLNDATVSNEFIIPVQVWGYK